MIFSQMEVIPDYNTEHEDIEALTVECLTVPLWYKQQVTFLNPKFD